MDNLREIAYITADATINEMRNKGMLQLQPTAFEKAMNDVKGFKFGLQMLTNANVPVEFKSQLAVQMVDIQHAIKRMKDFVDEQDYIIFCEHNIQNQSIRSIASKYGIDEGAVKRTLNRCIERLSIFLYPDVFISQILY